MTLDDTEFWHSLAGTANASEAFAKKAAGISPLTIRLAVGERDVTLKVASGRVAIVFVDDLRGYDVRIGGPRDEWQRMLGGVISYPQAVNHAQGRLRVAGDMVAGAWATAFIAEFFKPAASLLKGTA